MKKRYQVFVSSTYEDLKKERVAVMQALLELDCIPCGMELFPAADEEQWTVIRRVIDDCDYYILIISGRYGSVGPDGKSYTQMEYEYACTKGKPTISFLHANPDRLPSNRTEKKEGGNRALQQFREMAQRKLCKTWSTADELGSVVSRSMVQLMNQRPATGWVRADRVPDESTAQEIVRLRRKIEDLEEKLRAMPPLLSVEREDLAQGEEEITLRGEGSSGYDFYITTWREALSAVLAKLLRPGSDLQIRQAVEGMLERSGLWAFGETVTASQYDVERIVFQLRALGFIEPIQQQNKIRRYRVRLEFDTAWSIKTSGIGNETTSHDYTKVRIWRSHLIPTNDLKRLF